MAKQFRDRLPELIEFYRKHGRLPYSSEETKLYMWIYNNKSSYPPLINFIKENGIEVKKRLTIEERNHRDYQNFLLLQKYYENNNHSLSGLATKDRQLYSWMHNHKSSYLPLINFIKENGIKIKGVKEKLTRREKRNHRNFLLIQEYYENNNHNLSGLKRKDIQLFRWMHRHKSSYPPLSEFLDIIEEIKLGNKEAILLYNLKYSSQQ